MKSGALSPAARGLVGGAWANAGEARAKTMAPAKMRRILIVATFASEMKRRAFVRLNESQALCDGLAYC